MSLTLKKLLKEGTRRLMEAGVEEAALDAKYLLMEAFHLDTVHYLMEQNRELSETDGIKESMEAFDKMLEARQRRMPLQYITGSREFMGLEFYVNENVLIPRQDTETLVEAVLKDHPEQEIAILDMCTGSGCIALSLAKLGNYRSVLGVDLSGAALEVARKNAEHLAVETGTVDWLESDLFDRLAETGRQFDVIVSNPPYIPTKVIDGLEPEVRQYEPMAALDGKEDGLYFYRLLVRNCTSFLKAGGGVYFEIGYDQAEAVTGLLKGAGFADIEVIRDAPGLDRVVKARYKSRKQEVSHV